MKKRNISYIRKQKALRVLQNPIEADLQTFLNATLQLSDSSVVKKDIQNTLLEIKSMPYKLSA